VDRTLQVRLLGVDVQHAVGLGSNFRKTPDLCRELFKYLQVFLGHVECQSDIAEGSVEVVFLLNYTAKPAAEPNRRVANPE
jgi:hypothetical protein